MNAQTPVWGYSIGGDSIDNVEDLTLNNSGDIFISGGTTSEEIYLSDSIDTNSLVLGIQGQAAYGLTNTFIAKYSSDGSFLWRKSFNRESIQRSGVIGKLCSVNSNLLVGSTYNTFWKKWGSCYTGSNLAEGKGALLGFDGLGNCLWTRELGGGTQVGALISSPTAGFRTLLINYSEYSNDHTWFPSGSGIYNQSYVDPFDATLKYTYGVAGSKAIGEYDANGDLLWARPTNGHLLQNGINDEVFLAGHFSADSIDVDPDSASNLWLHKTGASGNLRNDFYLSKWDSNADLEWTKQISIGANCDLDLLATDEQNSIYVFGRFSNSQIGATLNYGSNTQPLIVYASGSSGSFLAKYDSTGNALWCRQFDGEMSDVNISIQSNRLLLYFNATSVFFMQDGAKIPIAQYSVENHNSIILNLSGNLLSATAFPNVEKTYYSSTEAMLSDSGLTFTIEYKGQKQFGNDTFQSAGDADIYISEWSLCDQISVSVETDTIVACGGDSVQLVATGADDYYWTDQIGNGESFMPTEPKQYIVYGLDENGCTGTNSVYVEAPYRLEDSITAVQNESVYIAGALRTQEGTYCDTIGPCDSIICTTLFYESNNSTSLDTCWNTGQKVVHSDRGTGDFFGNVVEIDGDWAAIYSSEDLGSSSTDAGAVYMFQRLDSGWTEIQKVVPNTQTAGDEFGTVIALDGDNMLIADKPSSGVKMYYFKRNTSNVWQQQQVITSGINSWPVTDIALQGNYAYAGVARQGKVNVYELSGSTWTLDTTISGSSSYRFGNSVDVDGSLLAIGAFWDDLDENGSNNIDKAGSASVFEKDTQGDWSFVGKAVSPSRESSGYFGADLSLTEGKLFVGCYTYDTIVNSTNLNQAGAVFRYNVASSVTYEQTIRPDMVFNGGLFGYGLDSDGDNLVVSHRRYSGTYNSTTLNWEGAVHVFRDDGSGNYEQTETFHSTNRTAGHEFGVAVAMSGGAIAVGTYFDNTDENNANAVTQAGAAHIFDGGCDPVEIHMDTVYETICSGDSIYLESAWQTMAGTYTDSIAIDTIRITELTVTSGIITLDTMAICDGDSVLVHGNYKGSPGTYTDTISTGGCDSISIIELIVGSSSYSFILEWIYQGDSIWVVDEYQTEADIYLDTAQTSTGCDSIIETFLWVYTVTNIYDTINICQGESILLGGGYQTMAGTYTDSTYQTGAVTITHTNLLVNSPVITTSNVTINPGDSTLIHGVWRQDSGTYCDTIGLCDSINCVTLSIQQTTYYTMYDSVIICNGDSHLAGGMYQTTSGVYYDTIAGSGNEDTVMVTTLVIDPQSTVVSLVSSSVWLKTAVVAGSYSWYDCDNEVVVNTSSLPYYAPGVAGNFALVVNNNAFCGDTSSCIYHSNTNKKGELQVDGYPTSVVDQYHIEFDSEQANIDIQLFDLQGQLLSSWQLEKQSLVTINLSRFAAGCYIARVSTEQGFATLKFMKLFE